MLEYKACPRCHGDMHTGKDMYGEYKECLQCGYMMDLERSSLLGLKVEKATEEAA